MAVEFDDKESCKSLMKLANREATNRTIFQQIDKNARTTRAERSTTIKQNRFESHKSPPKKTAKSRRIPDKHSSPSPSPLLQRSSEKRRGK